MSVDDIDWDAMSWKQVDSTALGILATADRLMSLRRYAPDSHGPREAQTVADELINARDAAAWLGIPQAAHDGANVRYRRVDLAAWLDRQSGRSSRVDYCAESRETEE